MEDDIELSTKIAQVGNQACFKSFYPEEIQELAGLFHKATFSAGEGIVNEGDPVDSVFLIIEGDVDVYKTIIDKDRKFHEEHVAVLGPGHAIGLSATGFYSLSGMRTATCIAKTDVIAIKLNIATFRGFTLAHSHAHSVMMKQSEGQNKFLHKALDEKS